MIWFMRCKLTVLVIQRHTIWPHSVLIKVSSDMNFLKSGVDIVREFVVCLRVPRRELLSNANEVVLDRCKVVMSRMATMLEVLKQIDGLDRV